MKSKASLFLTIFFIIIELNAQSEFKLVKKTVDSDINYLTIKNINTLPHGYKSMLANFHPVKGEYITYMFVKEFEGESKLFGLKTFHDLIILKTNAEKYNT